MESSVGCLTHGVSSRTLTMSKGQVTGTRAGSSISPDATRVHLLWALPLPAAKSSLCSCLDVAPIHPARSTKFLRELSEF